jgi:hypothetical protein
MLTGAITAADVTTFKAMPDGREAQQRVSEALETACDIFEHEVGHPMLCAMTTVADPVASAGGAECTPDAMYGIEVGGTLWCENADGTLGEAVVVTAVTEATFTATFTLAKAAAWSCRTEYAELLSGDGSDILMPVNWPIVKVRYVQVVDTEWRVVDSAAGTMLDLNTYQVFVPSHRLWLNARGGSYTAFTQGFGLNPSVRGAAFPDGVGNILVNYSAGYVAKLPSPLPSGCVMKVLPPRVKTAVCAIAHLFLNEKSWIGMGSKTVGGGFESIQQVVRKFEDYPIIWNTIDCERRRGT